MASLMRITPKRCGYVIFDVLGVKLEEVLRKAVERHQLSGFLDIQSAPPPLCLC